MHQNLLNAEFASIRYLNAKNEKCMLSGSLRRSQRCCTRAFAAHMPAVNCIFQLTQTLQRCCHRQCPDIITFGSAS
jgi:hypothetical protein